MDCLRIEIISSDLLQANCQCNAIMAHRLESFLNELNWFTWHYLPSALFFTNHLALTDARLYTKHSIISTFATTWMAKKNSEFVQSPKKYCVWQTEICWRFCIFGTQFSHTDFLDISHNPKYSSYFRILLILLLMLLHILRCRKPFAISQAISIPFRIFEQNWIGVCMYRWSKEVAENKLQINAVCLNVTN